VRRFTSIEVYTTDFGQHTEITFQDILNRECSLRLFVENQEMELQTKDNRVWTPTQRPYVPYFPIMYAIRWFLVCRGVSPTSELQMEIELKSGHLFWAKSRQAREMIDIQGIFNDFWSSGDREFLVSSQS
jgi:hypothetical protein